MWNKNNKEITENTITTVYFLFADHNIQDSAQLEEKKNQQTNTPFPPPKKKTKPNTYKFACIQTPGRISLLTLKQSIL